MSILVYKFSQARILLVVSALTACVDATILTLSLFTPQVVFQISEIFFVMSEYQQNLAWVGSVITFL